MSAMIFQNKATTLHLKECKAILRNDKIDAAVFEGAFCCNEITAVEG